MAISFNTVPSTLKVPGVYVEFDNSQAMGNATLMEYTALICGRMLPTGSAEPLTPISVTSAQQARELFGAGSQAALMAEAFMKINAYTSLKVMAIADGEVSVKAKGAIAIDGECTTSAPLYAYIGGRKVSCACASGTTAAVLATALAAAINAEESLPVTAEAESGEGTEATVKLTAKNAGQEGNEIDLRMSYYGETLPEGIRVQLQAMGGGAGVPDAEGIIAAMGDAWYHVIAWPFTDRASLRLMEDELVSRWGAMRHIDGVAFCAKGGTFGEVQEFGSGESAGNYAHISIVESVGSPDIPSVRAAAVAAVVAYYGNIDPARPFQTLELTGCLAPAPTKRLTLQEQNLLLAAGIATTAVDAGGTVSVQRLVTNYLKTSTGATDTSYQDVNTLLTLSYLRYDFRARILRKYPRHKLADDSSLIPAGQAIMTPKTGRAEAIAAFQAWQELGLVENLDAFKAGLVCERNAQDVNRLDWRLTPDLVNQFRIGAAQIQFVL